MKNINKKTKGQKTAYAWNSGKDSLVLGEICHMARIKDCVLVICNMEYRAFTEWTEVHKPMGLSVINIEQDMKWLVPSPHMLFPQNNRIVARWFRIV